MTLFIIGNGFDLSHNLKTSYLDFKNFISKEEPELLVKIFECYKYSFKRTYKDHFSEEELDVESLLWADFEKNMGTINHEEILEIDSDLGLEYPEASGYDTLESHLDLESIDISEDLFNILHCWIKSIDVENSSKKTSFISTEDENLFLTFNYTLLLEECYRIEEENICHIHGSIHTSPIMGHNNLKEIEFLCVEAKSFDSDDDNDYDDYNKIKKLQITKAITLYEKTLKNIEENIDMNINFFEQLIEIKEIKIIGHSLGEVDLPYFEEVSKSVEENALWKVYYYKEEDKDIFKEKLMNIGINESNILMCPNEHFFNI